VKLLVIVCLPGTACAFRAVVGRSPARSAPAPDAPSRSPPASCAAPAPPVLGFVRVRFRVLIDRVKVGLDSKPYFPPDFFSIFVEFCPFCRFFRFLSIFVDFFIFSFRLFFIFRFAWNDSLLNVLVQIIRKTYLVLSAENDFALLEDLLVVRDLVVLLFV